MSYKERDVWGPRECPRCGAQPGTDCLSATGKRASAPHRERFPEGPPRTWGKAKAAKLERMRERVKIQGVNRPPVDLALRQISRQSMEEFRDRQAAVG